MNIQKAALFQCQQRSDESNDSFLARTDVMWAKFLARKTKIEDIQPQCDPPRIIAQPGGEEEGHPRIGPELGGETDHPQGHRCCSNAGHNFLQ